MVADGAQTWILTAAPETHAAAADHGLFDWFVAYLTQAMRCAASIRITGELLMQRMHAAAGVAA